MCGKQTMRNIYGVTSLALFVTGLALAVTTGLLFPDADGQNIRNAWNVVSLVLFVVALALGAIAGIIRRD
jgi:hypothetical protein